LVVDDEPAIRRIIARVLTRSGHVVLEAGGGEQAAELVAAQSFDVIVSDISMPGMDGIALLKQVREHDLEVPVVLMSGLPNVDTAVRAVEYGALQYLVKPLDLARLDEIVHRAVNLHRMAVAKRRALESLGHAAQPGDRAGLEARFERALTTMWLAFQPIVRTGDGTLFGYEALLRSAEPTLPHPGAILDASEKLDRRLYLGQRIRAKAASAMGPFPERGLLFVNLHPQDLTDASLTSHTAPLSEMASRVVLEITERSALEEVENVRARIAALREMGFRIALDDFGAGYAGLGSFALLEPEIVKLDMSIVRDVDSTRTKRKLIKSITALCKDLGMLVVSEGVETLAERDALIELGTDLVQGYLLAKPGEPFPDFVW
jgi:EAL domain-containing protein (putative c-di-GMP-specific phosphodiesterase class I)